MSSPCTVQIGLSIQWGEMDSYGHVNNAVYFRWFESVRMEYFRRLDWPALESEVGVGPILHSTQARFRAPLEWPDEVEVGTRVIDVVDDRFTMLYEVRSARLSRVVCEGSGLVVAYDYRARTKALLPESIRQRILDLEAAGRVSG